MNHRPDDGTPLTGPGAGLARSSCRTVIFFAVEWEGALWRVLRKRFSAFASGAFGKSNVTSSHPINVRVFC